MTDSASEQSDAGAALPHSDSRTSDVLATAGALVNESDVASSDAQDSHALHSSAGLIPASKFLGRLSLLDIESLGEAIHLWHRTATESGDEWFSAEASIADAVHASRRYTEQDVLLRHMSTLFLESSWFTSAQPGVRIRASEPSAQYVATIAMLAVLVRDRLTITAFELLYRPFSKLIPVDTLLRE